MNKFSWSKENTLTVLNLANKNHTKQFIADKIGTTRNAVIGKLHRMKLKGSYKPPTLIEPNKRPIKNKKQDKYASIDKRYIGLYNLKNHQCRYPLDNDMFCGERIIDGKSYCQEHYEICIRIVEKK